MRVLILIGVFCTTLALGSEPLTPLASPDTVHEAASLALAQGVAWFRERAAQDPDGWLVGPARIQRAIGQTNVIVRCRKVSTPVPVVEFTNVVVFVQESAAEAPRRTIQRRPWRLTGKTNYIEKLEYDPNGPIVQNVVKALYEPRGNIFWRFSDLGDSALAVCALRRAGVPDTDPVIERNLANLRGALATYGLPDQTWNLAWLTMVFAETPGRECAEITAKLASRLVDGQLRDGSARGLWGPESFHHRLLAAALREYLVQDAKLKEAKQKLAKRDSRAAQKLVEDATEALSREKEVMDGITGHLLRLTAVELPFVWGDPNADPSVWFAGTSSFLYNQTAADLESTSVAVLGLAAAAAQQRLPDNSFRPAGRQLAVSAPPERALAVLARAANALASRQLSDGRWDEANVHQPVSDFSTFSSIVPAPAIPKSFVPLESPVTTASAANGAVALAEIGRTAGPDKLGPDLRRARDAGLSAVVRELDQWIATRRPKAQPSPAFQGADVSALLPATVLLSQKQLSGVAADELIRWLILAGQPNGSWRSAQRLDCLPSSSRARLAALVTQPDGVVTNQSLANLKLAHILLHNSIPSNIKAVGVTRNGDAYFTALAVMCLASYLDQPAVALAGYASDETLPRQRLAMNARLRQIQPPSPATAPRPATPASGTLPPAATVTPVAVPAAALPPASEVPDLPAANEQKRQADEAF